MKPALGGVNVCMTKRSRGAVNTQPDPATSVGAAAAATAVARSHSICPAPTMPRIEQCKQTVDRMAQHYDGRGAHAAVAIASASCPVAFGTSAVAVAVDALAGCAAGANPDRERLYEVWCQNEPPAVRWQPHPTR